MANEKEVYTAAMAGYQSELIAQQSAYQQAGLSGDVAAQTEAAMAMADVRARMVEFNNMAREAMAPARHVPMPGEDEMSHGDVALARKYGLSSQQVGVAKGWTSDRSMSDEDKVKQYVDNANRLRRMRESGEYRDDQGKGTY